MDNRDRMHGKGRVLAGLLIILFGGALLLERMDFPIPGWLWSWPMILIVVGVFVGMKNGFNDMAWIILIAIGGFFLIDKIVPWDNNIRKFFWPIAVIGWGLLVIFGARWRRRHDRGNNATDEAQPVSGFQPEKPSAPTTVNFASRSRTSGGPEDFLDSVSIFGGVKRLILSKNFKGADIVNIFGGSELNLSQCDFTQPPVMDITQMFGGTKLIVPSDWEVRSEMTAIFGGIDDKRQPRNSQEGPSKVVILRGTSIFGGIEIKSF